MPRAIGRGRTNPHNKTKAWRVRGFTRTCIAKRAIRAMQPIGTTGQPSPYGGLVEYGKVTKGEFVVLTAASSSVGIAAIEIVNVEGATNIATTRTAKKKKH